ncbi:hypothetical protein MM236_19105 [Belliella sp. DSM 107340]|uniref:Uncharacterized protein n=1 Tax=Belliella calami TaxID=2923436 RepID=A0ABS9UU09_9BACT|nr:hypothetical protein [Belliella calami]MCH7400112.1 hypothetical protein [Belliella calami]
MPNYSKEIFSIQESVQEKYPDLTDFESLQIACEIHKQELYAETYLLGSSQPNAIESIAIQMGMKENGFGSTLIDAIQGLTDAVSSHKE